MFEKTQKWNMSVSVNSLALYLADLNQQGSEPGVCAGQSFGLPAPYVKHWLSLIESPGLRFLIHADHRGVFERIQMESGYGCLLFAEFWNRTLFAPVDRLARFLRPGRGFVNDSICRGFRKPACIRKLLPASLATHVIGRSANERYQIDSLPWCNLRRFPASGQILELISDLCQKSPAPLQAGLPTQTDLDVDLVEARPFSCMKDELCPLGLSLFRLFGAHQYLQRRASIFCQLSLIRLFAKCNIGLNLYQRYTLIAKNARLFLKCLYNSNRAE